MSLKVYGPSTNPRVWQVQLVAEMLQIPLELVVVEYKDTESQEHTARNPFQRIPVLETADGFLFESNAICRYLARSKLEAGLYGATPFQQSQVDQWLDWTANELDPNFMTTVYQLLGYVPANEEAFKTAKNIINEKLKQLEGHFKNSAYLVGDKLTIADIALVNRIAQFFILLIDEKSRKQYPSVLKWFAAITELAQFRKIFGRPRLCKTAFPLPKQEAAPKEDKPKEQKQEKQQEKKEAAPKEQKPKEQKPKEQKQEQKPKEQPKPAPKQEEQDEPLPDKKKNPLDLLPPSPFNIDDYKRAFFASKDIAKNIEDLYQQVDVQGWSLWIVTYNKADSEGKKIILTNNLMKGFINQRLDQNFRKYSFAIHGVYGDEPNLEIRGAWLWRGTEVPQEWKDHVAYEHHVFRRIDITNEQDKKDFAEFWVNQEEDESKVQGLTARSLIYFR